VEPSCPFQRDQRIVHFASRGAMDIEGLGEKTVFALSDAGLVADAGDLYSLTVDDLISTGDFSPLTASRLLFELDQSRSRPLAHLLVALGIRHLGPVVGETLAHEIRSLDGVVNADAELLASINGAGEALAESITAWRQSQTSQRLIEGLRNGGVRFDVVTKTELKSTTLEGLTILVTGRIPGLSRDDVKDLIKKHGGRPASGVSSTLSLLVAGEKGADAKIKKAEGLGIRVIGAEEFLQLVVGEK